MIKPVRITIASMDDVGTPAARTALGLGSAATHLSTDFVPKAFSPVSLPGYLGYWGPRGRYADTGCSTAATASGPVQAWLDTTNPQVGIGLFEATHPPTLQSDGGLLFSGLAKFAIPAATWSQIRTAVVLLGGASNGAAFRTVLGPTTWNSASDILTYFDSTGVLTNYQMPSTGAITHTFSILGGGPRAYGIVYGATADRVYDLSDQCAINGSTGASGAVTRTGPGCLGNRGDGAEPFIGEIYGLYLDSNELTASAIAQVAAYMSADWQSSGYATPTNILFQGNSLIAGSALSNPTVDGFIPKLQAALPGANVVNLGQGGYTTPLLIADIDPQLTHAWDVRTRNVACLLEVTNDYNNAAAGVSGCELHYQQWIAAVAARGVFDDIVVCTVPQDISNSDRLLINASIRANYRAWGATKLIDFGLMAHIGTGNSTTDPTYWTDALHPSGLGNDVMVNGDGIIPGAAAVLAPLVPK